MKKALLIMVMALALLLTQCRKPEVKFPSPVAPEGTTVSMTVTAGPGSKTDITAAGAIKWSAGDKLYVGFDGKYVGCLEITSGQNTPTGWFSGNVTLPTSTTGNQTFHFFYLGSDISVAPNVGDATVDVSFATQEIYAEDGKLKNASKHHVGYGSAKGTVAGSEVTGINVTLVSKVALARFSFKKAADGTPYTGALTLSGTGIYNSMTVNFNGSFTHGEQAGNISLTDTENAEKYVMLVPVGTGSETLSFACDGFEGSKTLDSGIESNKFYGQGGPIEVVLTKVYEYVDLGLSVKWATCNVGASTPEDYGWYFMWGSTTNGGDSNCSWANCPGNGGNSSYNATAIAAWDATHLTNNVLNPEVDAATKNWGSDWRMPTKADFTELKNNTTRTWYAKDNTDFNGVAGWKCANKSDPTKYIFLPAAGYRSGTSINDEGSKGNYWGSELDVSEPYYCSGLQFSSGYCGCYNCNRYSGYPVRAVVSAQN